MVHLPHKCESEAQEDGLLLLEGFSLRANIGRVGDFCLGFIHMIIPYKEGTIYLLAVNNNMDEKIRYRDNGKFYIEKDDEPEYVLDPFSGSGTVVKNTGVIT